MNGVIEQAVDEKIKGLENRIKQLESELALARQASLNPMLGNLRLHGAILLYLGDKLKEEFGADLEQRFGSDIARDSVRHLFSINNAPVTDECRAELRTALNNGNTLW